MNSEAPNLQIVEPNSDPNEPQTAVPTNLTWVWQWVVGAVLVALIGTWAVWFSAYAQRTFVEQDVREACQRVMPDTVQRCVDTVTIQRGGLRR